MAGGSKIYLEEKKSWLVDQAGEPSTRTLSVCEGVGVQDGARWHTEANAHRHHHATSEASAPSTPFGTRYLAVEPFLLAASASLVMMTGAVAVATTVAFSLADPGQLSAGRLLQPAERARLGNPFRPQLSAQRSRSQSPSTS